MVKQVKDYVTDSQSHEEYKNWYIYEYERPAVTVDAVCMYMGTNEQQVLLIQRKNSPYKSHFALPGGFLNIDEKAEDGVKRELFEETGIKATDVHLLNIYDDVYRDTRSRVISIAYYIPFTQKRDVVAGDDAENAVWIPVSDAKKLQLAFDHNKILKDAVNELQLQYDFSRR